MENEMWSVKFIFKLIKAKIKLWLKKQLKRFWLFMIKKRGIESYKTKKRILVVVLVFIDCFIWWKVAIDSGIEYTKKITIENNKNDVGVVVIEDNLMAVAHASNGEAEKEMERIEDPAPSPTAEIIEKEINSVFGENSKIALAIFKTESALNPEAQNWNCHYYKNGKRYSTSCKKEDRQMAWSVDCGIAQINHITPNDSKECPVELFDYKKNIQIAKNMFDKRGFQPWVTYNEGYYKGNL
jgi:hypothetical protein